MKELFSLQFILNEWSPKSFKNQILSFAAAGGKWVQLRMKEIPSEKHIAIAKEIKSLCTQKGLSLLVNDYVELAKEIDADGIHLGKGDMPVVEARSILGNQKIIGGTANCFQDVIKLNKSGADYIGLGPFRFTTTKKNLSESLGLDGYKEIIQQMQSKEIKIPIYAIGGIKVEDVLPLMSVGVSGVAISGEIANADHIESIVRDFLNVLN
ncbi:MAG: thiamine phosphate synthase [Bacteroidales bacterium]